MKFLNWSYSASISGLHAVCHILGNIEWGRWPSELHITASLGALEGSTEWKQHEPQVHLDRKRQNQTQCVLIWRAVRKKPASCWKKQVDGSLEFKVSFVCVVSFRSGLHLRPCLRKKKVLNWGKITNCTSELVILWAEFLSSIFFPYYLQISFEAYTQILSYLLSYA